MIIIRSTFKFNASMIFFLHHISTLHVKCMNIMISVIKINVCWLCVSEVVWIKAYVHAHDHHVSFTESWRISFSLIEKEIITKHGNAKTCCETHKKKCCRWDSELFKELWRPFLFVFFSEALTHCEVFVTVCCFEACDTVKTATSATRENNHEETETCDRRSE